MIGEGEIESCVLVYTHSYCTLCAAFTFSFADVESARATREQDAPAEQQLPQPAPGRAPLSLSAEMLNASMDVKNLARLDPTFMPWL